MLHSNFHFLILLIKGFKRRPRVKMNQPLKKDFLGNITDKPLSIVCKS